MSSGIDQLIINSPYLEPNKHWLYNRETQEFKLENGRRKSGYWKQSEQDWMKMIQDNLLK